MRNYGQSEWDTSFGVRMRHADSSVMRIGESRSYGMKKLDSLVGVSEFFAPAWLTYSNAVLILTLNALDSGNSSRTRPILIGCS
jgi:hypothetical protein